MQHIMNLLHSSGRKCHCHFLGAEKMGMNILSIISSSFKTIVRKLPQSGFLRLFIWMDANSGHRDKDSLWRCGTAFGDSRFV